MAFTIHVMQHAHTDIGYTHPREQIMWMYLDHFDKVLELCRATEDRDEASRFKWVCETSWQVKHYLDNRPERLEDFLHFVRAGQIEVTANYLHSMDLIDEDAIRRSLEWVVAFCKEHDLPLTTALHSDINGWPWAMPELLSEAGVKRFASQVHIDSATDPLGARGSTHYHWLLEDPDAFAPDTPVRIPQAFWWEGPSGEKVLHWLGEHYLLGNVLGISSYKPFGANKTMYFTETDKLSVDDLLARAEVEVPRYIERLQRDGYGLPALLISTGGFYVDNAPPDGRWLDVIDRLNERLDGIEVRTSTLHEWFEALEATGNDWPTVTGTWPDHWSHGLGALTDQVARARRTQRRRAAAADLVERSSSEKAARTFHDALEEERMALEHTFNAWSTSVYPGERNVSHQTAAKNLTFHRAEMLLDEAIGTALRELTSAPEGEADLRYIGDVATLHFDTGDLVLDPTLHALEAEDGTAVAFQRDHAALPHFVCSPPPAADIAALRVVERSAAPDEPATDGLELSAEAWTLRVDPATGGLASLVDAGGHEWAGPDFGVLTHKTVIHPGGRPAVHNPARFKALDIAGPSTLALMTDGPITDEVRLAFGDPVRTTGQVYDAISLAGVHERVGTVVASWRLYHQAPVAELVLDWEKRWSDLPEVAYVSFPFAGDDPSVRLEAAGGLFTPGQHGGAGQVPGTSSRYYTIQRGAHVKAGGAELAWLPVDAPLVMTNEAEYNHWETDPYAWNGFLASMPVNHFWHTNFPVSQSGPLRLRYRFAPISGSAEDSFAAALPTDALGWR